MDDLIEALTLFESKFNTSHPTHCEHDELIICGEYSLEMFSDKEIARLDELGFFWSEADECFKSFRFGSC